jgi:hypothetical protein
MTNEDSMKTNRQAVIKQGFFAGLIGFATVAVIFMIVSVVAGRSPLHTAAVLGAALFKGATDPALVEVELGPVAGYTMVHLGVFIAFGMLAALLAAFADRGWQLWFVALFVMIFVAFHLYAAVQSLAAPMRAVLSDAMIWGAGVAASVAMAAYLLRAHPRIRAPQPW